MRISVTGTGTEPGDELTPIDPPPPPNINDFFTLVSPAEVKPFHQVEVTWSIQPEDDVEFSDFIFTLVAGAREVETNLSQDGLSRVSIAESVIVRIVGRHDGSGGSSTLGQGVIVRIDDSECEEIEIASVIVDALVVGRLSQITSEASELRLRRRIGVTPGGQPTVVEREVESTWELGVIKYYFPLEVVINNFFNADLDVRLEIRFSVTHAEDNTDLDVTITHSSDVDFSTVENILSLGNSSTAATTANRLIPLILDCRVRGAEQDILRQVLAFLGNRLDTHRLLYLHVVPLDGFSYLAIGLCPIPEEPPEDPVIVGADIDGQ
jgi:hypothetical protein